MAAFEGVAGEDFGVGVGWAVEAAGEGWVVRLGGIVDWNF